MKWNLGISDLAVISAQFEEVKEALSPKREIPSYVKEIDQETREKMKSGLLDMAEWILRKKYGPAPLKNEKVEDILKKRAFGDYNKCERAMLFMLLEAVVLSSNPFAEKVLATMRNVKDVLSSLKDTMKEAQAGDDWERRLKEMTERMYSSNKMVGNNITSEMLQRCRNLSGCGDAAVQTTEPKSRQDDRPLLDLHK